MTTIAKQSDGTIQLTFTIPWKKVSVEREKALFEMAKTVEVSGFRKGKAPLDKVKNEVKPQELIEKTLNGMLGSLFSEAIKEHNLKPAIFPQFELISANEGADWQVRAVTCDIPNVTLGAYKKAIKFKKGAKKEEKEKVAIDAIMKTVKVTIPALIINQEVEARLASLLERLEKLGLNLESYLASIKKDAKKLRQEYKKQAEESLKLEFVMGKIAMAEKFEATEKEIDEFIKATGDKRLADEPTKDQLASIKSVIRKRKTLDYLVSLG